MGIVGIALKEANKKKNDKEIICYKIDIIKNDIDIVCVDLANKEKLDKELGGTDEKIIFIQLSGKRFGLVTNLDSDKFLLFRALSDDESSWTDVLEEDYSQAEYITQI